MFPAVMTRLQASHHERGQSQKRYDFKYVWDGFDRGYSIQIVGEVFLRERFF